MTLFSFKDLQKVDRKLSSQINFVYLKTSSGLVECIFNKPVSKKFIESQKISSQSPKNLYETSYKIGKKYSKISSGQKRGSFLRHHGNTTEKVFAQSAKNYGKLRLYWNRSISSESSFRQIECSFQNKA